MEYKWEEVQLQKYYEKDIQPERLLENLGILNKGFTQATGRTTLGMQTVITNSNHMGFLYMVALMDSRERFYGLN